MSTSTTSKKSIAFREVSSRIIDKDIVCLEAYSDKYFRYWETVTLHGIERIYNAPPNEWIPCNIGGNNISMAWRVYWENNAEFKERGTELHEDPGIRRVRNGVSEMQEPDHSGLLLHLQNLCRIIVQLFFSRPRRNRK